MDNSPIKELIDPNLAYKLEDKKVTNKHKLEESKNKNEYKLEESKNRIAYLFIIGYGSLLAFIFLIPLGIFLINDKMKFEELTEIITVYNGLLASLTGMLGFVVGYYFNNKSSST